MAIEVPRVDKERRLEFRGLDVSWNPQMLAIDRSVRDGRTNCPTESVQRLRTECTVRRNRTRVPTEAETRAFIRSFI
jgi:hypothetical protein